MANINTKCKHCGEKICNGVGPSGLPTITTILNMTPSGSLFFDDACQHDQDYHLQIGKKLADDRFLTNMELRVYANYPKHSGRWFDWVNPVNAARFSGRKYFLWRAKRMHWYVDKFGDTAYKEGACKMLKS
jgi:hypothetical protein